MSINANINFSQGPFTLDYESHPTMDFHFVLVLDRNGKEIDSFEDQDQHKAEELLDWLNNKYEGKRSPMPSFYKSNLEWRACQDEWRAERNA